jgi:putative heme iron utilization protein
LLFDATAGLDEPLTGSRVSVLGRAEPTDLDRHARRYRARHPESARYSGFRDFALYRVAIERVHMVAGFGRIHWIASDEFQLDEPTIGSLATEEAGLVRHLNEALGELVARCAGGQHADPPRWTVTGVDPDGLDLRREATTARLDFPRPAASAEAVCDSLLLLAQAAGGGQL